MSETATWAEEQKIHLLVVQSLVPSRPMFLGGLLSAMADRLAILALAGRPYAYVHGSYARRKISRRLFTAFVEAGFEPHYVCCNDVCVREMSGQN